MCAIMRCAANGDSTAFEQPAEVFAKSREAGCCGRELMCEGCCASIPSSGPPERSQESLFYYGSGSTTLRSDTSRPSQAFGEGHENCLKKSYSNSSEGWRVEIASQREMGNSSRWAGHHTRPSVVERTLQRTLIGEQQGWSQHHSERHASMTFCSGLLHQDYQD